MQKYDHGSIFSCGKKIKGLKRENLRDHMDDFELILTMLGERTTAEIHRTKDTKGLPRLKDDARRGGQVAGTARKQIERNTWDTLNSLFNVSPFL